MGVPIRLATNHDGWHVLSGGQQEVVNGRHPPFNVKPKLPGRWLQCVKSCHLHEGLKDFLQTPLTDGDFMPLQDAPERGKPAVGAGGLWNVGNEITPGHFLWFVQHKDQRVGIQILAHVIHHLNWFVQLRFRF